MQNVRNILTESKIFFSDYQQCEYGVDIQNVGECFRLHLQGLMWWISCLYTHRIQVVCSLRLRGWRNCGRSQAVSRVLSRNWLLRKQRKEWGDRSSHSMLLVVGPLLRHFKQFSLLSSCSWLTTMNGLAWILHTEAIVVPHNLKASFNKLSNYNLSFCQYNSRWSLSDNLFRCCALPRPTYLR